MIRSRNVENVQNTIDAMISNKNTVVAFDDFKNFYDINNKNKNPLLGPNSITTSHMKFILSSFSSQGVIEYYPEILDTIIFNDELYNKLRSGVPIIVEQNKGVISIKDIKEGIKEKLDGLNESKINDYIKILDQYYINFGVSIENDDIRIFPQKLKSRLESIPEPYKALLKDFECKKLMFKDQKFRLIPLLKSLSEMKLRCIDVSKNAGIFSWENSACIYYIFQSRGDAVRGTNLECEYYIGGTNKSRCERLETEFPQIVEKMHEGIILDSNQYKKKDPKKITKYDVALSFAGEQRKYVEEINNILERKGINVFYDEMYKHKLWGQNLSDYLQRIFKEEAIFCIMFISREYVTKPWPSHERKNAISKQIEIGDGYILPVRFDDTKVPGLDSSISYLDARKMSPQQIACEFLKKLDDQ